MTITPQTKNSITFTNQSLHSDTTWDDANYTWDDTDGTWDLPGTHLAKETKNSPTWGNQTKN